MGPFVLLYQLLTLLTGLAGWVTLAVFHRVQPSPLGQRVLTMALPLTAFYLLVCVSSYVVQTPGLPVETLEYYAALVYMGLYAALGRPVAAFGAELAQRPFGGPSLVVSRGLTVLGGVLVLGLVGWPGTPVEKAPVARLVLQAGYLPLLLGALAAFVVVLARRQPSIRDPWKKQTARWVVAGLVAGFPLLVVDALWPWLAPLGWPRGLNLHGLVYAAFGAGLALRWARRFEERETTAAALPPPDPARVVPLGLTARETEVLNGMFAGLTNPELAERLGLSLGTVKNHVYRVYQKAGASSRRELVAMLGTTPP